MIAQWLIILVLLSSLQLISSRLVDLDEYVKGEEIKEDRFGIANSFLYRLTNKYSGTNRTLEAIILGDKADGIEMSPIRRYGTEYWRFIRLGKNKYRIQNLVYDDEKSLDIINDKMRNRLRMSKTAEVTGQYWHLTRLNDGSFRLSNDFSGRNMALDVQTDTHKPRMFSNTVDYLGQHWTITKVGKYSRY
ncbi:hypothetical protein I4U23_015725 [Adineta vaga]|nr:hypothetical protein I4U23_015725 [Adineta vaga]